MAMTSTKTFDNVQWDADGMLWVRESVVVEDGGREIARTFLRTSYAPGDNIPDDAPPQVTLVAAIAWTPAVVAAHRAKQQTVNEPE
jgi:hypothetical protein